ncbi:hypothetical protein COV82_00735 [Candidatus Peregrinibacteria bacterium CG11_big_fil_rev_8_21_14_0_20_46_8]|nr:MAG: hypothetical protein COV82_00735 [Candidatus Peregrinibacteria bacterium CG11_big_fil_rev_8_21_14_0_20_46_8]
MHNESIEQAPSENLGEQDETKETLQYAELLKKIQGGETLEKEEAQKLTALPREIIQHESIWPLYAGLWKLLDKAMGPTRTVWEKIPGIVQRGVYTGSNQIQQLVRVGILDLKNVSDEEIQKMDKERSDAAQWLVKIAAMLDPEVRAIKPLLDAAFQAGDAFAVVNEELKTEIRAARVEKETDAGPEARAA